MNTKVKTYICWLPTCIYILYVAYMQSIVSDGFWIKGAVLSLFASLLYTACFIQMNKNSVQIGKKIMILFNSALTCLLVFLAVYVGKDAETALISGVAIHSIMAFIFAIIIAGKKTAVFVDKDTGAYYRVIGKKAYRLSDIEVRDFCSMQSKHSSSVKEFSSSNAIGFSGTSAVIPITYSSNGLNNSDFNTGTAINPSSGMPMVGGISGLDIHGNSWGTNFNEPSSTYDPNRGY